MVGLSRGTTKAHIARAALESIAFQSAEVLLAMQRDARQPLVELRVDGGATANDLMMQFQADLLGVPVVRPKVTETTALGAAYLAGLAVGFWSSLDEVAANWQVDRRFEPRMGRELAAARLRQWERAVERSRDWHVED
jgi:glycerol kinase